MWRAGAFCAALLLAAACTPSAPVAPACAGAAFIGADLAVPAGDVGAPARAHYPEEAAGPVGPVAAFRIDATEVTNAQFAAFVQASGYITVAERTDARGARRGAAVFSRQMRAWRIEPGADWRHPLGPGSTIRGRDTEPVVAVAYEDAEAYARWRGRRLPSEAEWERAARLDAPSSPLLQADIRDADGAPAANVWGGLFPVSDSGADGYQGVAPVGCYAPNAAGAYDMIGNVWEWTADWYSPTTRPLSAAEAQASDPEALARRVIKGGSHLCALNFCARFRTHARQPGDPSLGASHLGFRTAADETP